MVGRTMRMKRLTASLLAAGGRDAPAGVSASGALAGTWTIGRSINNQTGTPPQHERLAPVDGSLVALDPTPSLGPR